MLDTFGTMAKEAGPAMNAMGKLSVKALDTLPLPLLVILFLACIVLLNAPIHSNSLLPTYSPVLADKDRLSPLPPSPPSRSPHMSSGALGSAPQYVAVVSTGRRSSRFGKWRSTSLESVQEVDEKVQEV